jgi:hypothetical protein
MSIPACNRPYHCNKRFKDASERTSKALFHNAGYETVPPDSLLGQL